MTAKAAHSHTRKALRFFLLPEILPRLRAFGGTGFGYLAFLIASVYRGVRILPAGHPYTLTGNIGTFTIRQVVSEAANHVTLSYKTIDQVIIFLAVLAGLVILALQFLLLLVSLVSSTAWAAATQPADFAGLFATKYPENDIAFLILDNVFGIPEFFKSSAEIPTDFHLALQALFQFYNLAILVVAVVIFLYFVIVVVAETAQSGTPFGKRFSHVYAPLRLVFALGLLVPLNYGFNAAQYITLLSARLGSGLASNGWEIFNRTLDNPMGLENSTLIARPVTPEITSLVEFMTIVNACREAYFLMDVIEIEGYYVYGGEAVSAFSGGANAVEAAYNTARDTFRGGNIEIIFGEHSPEKHSGYDGNVRPYCGKVTVSVTANDAPSVNADGDGSPDKLQEQYFRMVWFMWGYGTRVSALGERMAHAYIRDESCYRQDWLDDQTTCNTDFNPPITFKTTLLRDMQDLTDAQVNRVFVEARENLDFRIEQEVIERGWGAAGIWYNKIAQVNGAYSQAVMMLPAASEYPEIMEFVMEERRKQDRSSTVCERFSPNLADGEAIAFPDGAIGTSYAEVMNNAYKYWRCEQSQVERGNTANIFWDSIHALFGTNGLFEIRAASADNIHPLAQLTTIGHGLVTSAVRNLGYSMGFAFAGGIASVLEPHIGAGFQAASAFFVSIATIALTAGFVLYYILPFLPFIYFFFAVGAWVKTIFEAMVGAPLWALAHLRIDGEGFPGQSASSGYFLIFEIFIRPILTVVGLIGGMAIFTAMTVILNEIFDIVVLNTTGVTLTGTVPGAGENSDLEFDRHIVDEFFFTIVYAVLLYMVGTASFKMIDMVPDGILKWMGASVSTMGDAIMDPTQGLTQYAAIGGASIGGQLAGAMNTAASGGGKAIGGVVRLAADAGRSGNT